MSWRKYLKFFILCALAIVILWYFGSSLDWSAVSRSLQSANLSLLALATFVICFGYLLRAFRWQTLLSPITPSNLRELFATTTIGFAAVFIFGRAGEVVRPLWLPMRDPRVRPSAALVTIGVERLCDLAAIIILFTLNLLWFRPPIGREGEFAVVYRLGLTLLIGTVVGITGLLIFKRLSKTLIGWFENKVLAYKFIPRRLAEFTGNLLNHLAASLEVLRNPRALLLTVIWTGLLWLSISLPTWMIILAFNPSLSFSDALFVMGWAVIGSLIPTPGGAAGAFHTATAAGLIFIQVNREEAAATAIIMHLIYFAPALFFGFYYLVRGDVSWERIRSLVISDKDNRLNQPLESHRSRKQDYLTAEALSPKKIYE